MSLDFLRTKLANKQNWIDKKYNYYEKRQLKPDPSNVIPQREKWAYNSTLGWATEAVDSLADRLTFEGFENDMFNFWNVFQMNNPDLFFDNAIRSALISACCFVYISLGDDGFPRLQIIDGRNATGTIDPITNLLKEGYAVLETDEKGIPITEAYFTTNEVAIVYRDKEKTRTEHFRNDSGYTTLVPVIYRPDAKRPFGQSRISKDIMDLMDKARFTVTRAEVAAEFASIPQKYILGLSPEFEMSTAEATYKSVLAIDKDSDGDKPVVGQFQAANINQHLEQLKMYRNEFEKAAGLASKEDLEHLALKAQSMFGSCFLNIGLVAASMRDGMRFNRNKLFDVKPVWKPVFKLDNSVISSFGDGIIKINQAIPGAIDAKAVKQLTGLPIEVNDGAGYRTGLTAESAAGI